VNNENPTARVGNLNIEGKEGEVLNLKENVQAITSERNNININNSAHNTHNNQPEVAQPVFKRPITISDYEELDPKELLEFDQRTTLTYLKDLMILEHTILSLFFFKSLKFPLFMRVLKVVFNISMQFAVNAMLYTDDVIDARQTNKENVY
jgi:hypothetical protein